MAYKMMNNSYYASLANKIINKYKLANNTLKMICENNQDEFPKKEVLRNAIGELSMQYNNMMNEIISILDMIKDKNDESVRNKSNKLIEEIAQEIAKDVNDNFRINSFLSPMGPCNLIMIKNTIVLYCKDDLKFRLEYSTPDKAGEMYLLVYTKLGQYSA